MPVGDDHPLLAGPYFRSEARKRGLTPQQLAERLIELIATDQMVLAILDDAAEVRARQFPNLRAAG